MLRKGFHVAVCLAMCLAVGGGTALVAPARGQTEFKAALEKKYDKTIVVSCNACHVLGKGKEVRNDGFGKALEKALDGKMITARLDEVKDLELMDPKRVKVKEEVTKEFLEVFKKLETEKSPDGSTYGDAIKQGRLDGVKIKDE